MLHADVEGKGANNKFLLQKRRGVKLEGGFTCNRVGAYNLIFPSLVL